VSAAELYERAVQAARAGRKEEARDLLIETVELDPQHEKAWIGLAGLVDSVEDRIIACQNVLTLNPANEKVRAYLAQLQSQEQRSQVEKNIAEATSLFDQARQHARDNDIETALRLARQVVEKHEAFEKAWLFIARFSADLEERIQALEQAYRLNPSNPRITAALKEAREAESNPMGAARRLEQLGKFEEALDAYRDLAAKARNSREFDHIYKQIVRIERHQEEKIQYVAPATSILRLTIGWPLLYLSLALVQVGLNPFAHPALYLWLGLPFVVLGSFLLSLAEIRSRHIVWQKLFDEHDDASTFARLVAAMAGWFLILIPHILLLFDSLNRLRYFTIPPMPF
jgi:tetratricopeptide (TPR) repeat protein